MLLSSLPHPLYARLYLRTITASMKRQSVRQLINGAGKSRAPDRVWNGRAVKFRWKGSAAQFGLYPKREGNAPVGIRSHFTQDCNMMIPDTLKTNGT